MMRRHPLTINPQFVFPSLVRANPSTPNEEFCVISGEYSLPTHPVPPRGSFGVRFNFGAILKSSTANFVRQSW
jgi:hypothetical protein